MDCFGWHWTAWNLKITTSLQRKKLVEPKTFIIVSPCGYFQGNLVGNFQAWKFFRILKGPEEATKVWKSESCPTFVGSRAGLSGKGFCWKTRRFFFLRKKHIHRPFARKSHHIAVGSLFGIRNLEGFPFFVVTFKCSARFPLGTLVVWDSSGLGWWFWVWGLWFSWSTWSWWIFLNGKLGLV